MQLSADGVVLAFVEPGGAAIDAATVANAVAASLGHSDGSAAAASQLRALAAGQRALVLALGRRTQLVDLRPDRRGWDVQLVEFGAMP